MANILIVEDNPANMKLAKVLLTHAGHSVLCAPDAEVGIALANSDHPELILMDLQLPGMDGFVATSLLKAAAGTARIPIIAVTALAMKEDRERAVSAGCDGYIAKPLDYKELYRVIETVLSKASLRP
jgi:two-component system cell cycle response regulator DivK